MPLHAELQPYLHIDDRLGYVLQAPWIYCVPFFPLEVDRVNQSFEVKLKYIEEANLKKDWNRYVWLHEKPWRLWAFCKIKHCLLDPADYWSLLSEIWIGSENIFQNKRQWLDCLMADVPKRELFMTDKERGILEQLKLPITIYRGHKSLNKCGLSWTLDRKTADCFAKRCYGLGEVRAAILHDKSKIFAYLDGRDEQEIILLN